MAGSLLDGEMDLKHLISQIVHNVQRIRALAEGVSDHQARWKPDPASWSILAEVIRGFTMAAAITSDQEQRQGSVSVGKLADMTIFDRDIFALNPDSYPEVAAAGTVVGEKLMYRAFD